MNANGNPAHISEFGPPTPPPQGQRSLILARVRGGTLLLKEEPWTRKEGLTTLRDSFMSPRGAEDRSKPALGCAKPWQRQLAQAMTGEI